MQAAAEQSTTDLSAAVRTIFDLMGSGDVLGAFDRFYAEDVVMQENAGEPTVGHAANREREIGFLNQVKEWRSLDVHAIGTSGDTADGVALIEYSFDFLNTQDEDVRYEQVAVQTWKGGRIVKERFYYNAGG